MTSASTQSLELMSRAVEWPAVIQYAGDDELVFISELTDFLQGDGLSAALQDVSDRLIDSQGQVFTLLDQGSQELVPQAVDETVTVPQLITLVRKHFAISGACCVSKIHADSIAECMQLLRHEVEA